MTDDSLPLISSSKTSSLSNDKKLSSWNFDDLHNESDNSNDFFSVLKKNVYLDEQINNDNLLTNKLNEHSTIRIDSSDLISRCKHFLPLLTDANQRLLSKIKSGENVRIELDSDQDNENDEKIIEMNLMFCPNVNSSSESDISSDENDDKQIKTTTTSLQFIKNKTQVNIIEIPSNNIIQKNKSTEIVNK